LKPARQPAAGTHAGGSGDALSAEIAAAIAAWTPQTEAIAADLAAGGIHLGSAPPTPPSGSPTPTPTADRRSTPSPPRTGNVSGDN
jgi:hypothetical protein